MVSQNARGRRSRGPRSWRHLVVPRPPIETEQAYVPSQLTGADTGTDGPPAEPNDRVSQPTRYLCAWVYADERLREQVRTHLNPRSHKAWAPCYAVDLVALLRHNRRAGRLAATRDWLLIAVLLADMTVVSYLLFGRQPVGFLAVLTVVVAVAALRVVASRRTATLRAILRSIGRYLRRHWRKFPERFVVPAVVVMVFISTVFTRPVGRLCLLVVLAGFAAAWLLVAGFGALSFALASRVFTSPDGPRERAPELPTFVEQRAERVARGNLLVYSGNRGDGRASERSHIDWSALGPFVGAGHRLTRWTTPPVNIRVGKPDSDGNPTKPLDVDVLTLHERLKADAERLRLPKLRCEHRLYVDGRWLVVTPDLLARPEIGPPSPRVDEHTVLERIADPLEHHRGYLCLQVTDWKGEVVVTMVVRAVLDGDLLQLEVSVHALPEVRVGEPDEDEDVDPFPRRPRRHRAPVEIPPRAWPAGFAGLRAGTRSYFSILFGATRRCSWAVARPLVTSIAGMQHRRTSRRGFITDFGTDASLREQLAVGQHMHYNAFFDTMGHAERLQYRLIKATADYLTARDVDIRDFTGRSETIITHNQQNIFTDFKAGAVTFGNNSSATNSTNSQPGNGSNNSGPTTRST